MAALPQNLDYTDKDFDSLRARLIALVQSVFPDWTDFNVTNFAVILLELYCFVGDVLGFYQDNQSNESRIVTASQRRSLIGLCKLINFTPSGAGAATVDVTFSIPAPVAGAVTLRRGDKFSTADVTAPVSFQLLADVSIAAGLTGASGVVENSENAQDVLTSTNLANQEFLLTATPFVDGSAQVVAADGAYVQVDSFLSSTGVDRHFVVVVDQNDRAHLRFGNGTNGAIPSGTIAVAYKTGGGSDGNVDPNTVRVPANTYADAFGTPVQLGVTNPLKASGGRARMTNAEIKVRAPASLRAPVNSVAREDFVINAQRLPGVARALMLTSNEDPAVPENTGDLYVIPTGGGAPSAALKAQVLAQVTVAYPCTLTFQPSVRDPLYTAVDVSVTAFKRAGYTAAQMKAEVVQALTDFFVISNADGTPNEAVDFGANMLDVNGLPIEQLAWSDVQDVVRDCTSVRKIDPSAGGFLLNGVRADLTIEKHAFPQLGTVTVTDGDTGLTV